MAEIRQVNPQEMLTTAKSLSGKVEEWNVLVDDIYALQQQLDAMWDGNANDTFNAQWAEDRTKYATLSNVLAEYVQAINTAAQLYIETEAEAVKIVNS
ncbi:MAG: WXG100 family type VII secretion target [Oscillospiraceae bacterium]|nr:WXG100 family type VII secretion target [Oscillospiraceae bacterium]